MEDKVFSLLPMIPLLAIILLIVFRCIKKWKSGTLFSPLLFVSLYYSYYVVIPFFYSEGNIYKEITHTSGVTCLVWATLLSLLFTIIGYRCHYRILNVSRVNNLYNEQNSLKLAVLLFVIGFVGYVAFNGFSFDIVRMQEEMVDAGANIFNHTDSYVTNLVSLFPVAICLAYYQKKKKMALMIALIAFVCAVMGGARWKFILIILPFITLYHLYPNVRKVKIKIWLPIFLIFYFSMGIIEQTRNYGNGLDLQKLQTMDKAEMTNGASENEMVYYFSAQVMDVYSKKEPLYFESLYAAITMPLPRAVFPWKSDAQYLRDANINVLGTVSHGAAYLNIVESYLAFRWLGVVVNGLFIGLLCGAFWQNYQQNKQSLGAIIFLGLFNGVLFVMISRGYLAQELQVFVYYIFVVHWISLLLNKLCKR